MPKDTEPIKPIDLGNVKEVGEELGYIENALLSIASTLSETIKTSLQDIKDQGKGVGQILANEVTKSIKGIARGLGDTLSIQEKIYSGQISSKDIIKKIEGLEQKRTSIARQLDILEKEGILTAKQRLKGEGELNEAIKAQEILLKAGADEAAQLEKGLGLSGKTLKSIKKVPFLKDFIDTDKVAGKLRKKLKDSGKEFLTMRDILPEIGASFKEGLKDPATLFALGLKQGEKALSGISDGVKSTVSMLDEYNGKLTKNFAISQDEASALNLKFQDIKNSAGSGLVTVSGIGTAFVTLNAKAGTFADISEKTLQTFDKLNKAAGISAEALTELNDLTYLNKSTLEETTKEFTKQLGVLNHTTGKTLNLKQLQEDIKNVSAAVKLNFGGSATAIAEAVFKAKALGVELKDLENISSSLLNFQSSIEDELAAELLTGRQLNLEGARYAALIGNQAMLAEELANNIGTAADFTNMTVIGQDALAKSLGMNRNQLAETLIQQERLNKLNAEGTTLQERYNNLRKEGRSEAEIANMLADEGLAKQLESAGIQEQYNLLVTNFKEQFLVVATKILPMISGTLAFIGKNMGALVGIAITLKGLQLAIAAATIAASFAANPIGAAVGIGLSVAAIGAITGLVAGIAIGDGQFDNTTGNFEISKNEGGIFKKWTTSDNDVIQVKPKDVANQGPAASTVSIAPSNTNVTLTLNGAVVANTVAKDKYTIGDSWKAAGGAIDMSAER